MSNNNQNIIHNKGVIIRIYPTKDQYDLIWKHIHACRFIWNYMLSLQQDRYREDKKLLSGFQMCNLLTDLKKDTKYLWLNDVSNTSLKNTCMQLYSSYCLFYKRVSRLPKYKTKKYKKQSYPLCVERLRFKNGFVHIQKIGNIKYKTDIDIELYKKFSNACVKIINNKVYVLLSVECENQAQVLTDKLMGIDLGVKELAVVAYGNKQFVFHNINKCKKIHDLEHNIKYIQRKISRKYKVSKARTGKYEKTKNIDREEEKIRKMYARLNGIRNNYLHQTTHTLISMLPAKVIMEDLNVSGMMKNKHLSKAVQEQCFYEFIRQMKYKCEWNGIEFIQASRSYPSSKTCSCCGSIKRNLKLSDRTYVCLDCGLVIDRDYNAAINLMKYGTH